MNETVYKQIRLPKALIKCLIETLKIFVNLSLNAFNRFLHGGGNCYLNKKHKLQ